MLTSNPLQTREITVFIPARNAARTVGRCVAAVSASTGVRSRVVVINDRSSDRTAEIAREQGATVVDTPPGAGGLGVGRNLALDLCETRYLAFLNADCYAHPKWLAELIEALASTGAAVAGGRQEEIRTGTLAERWKAVHLRQDLGGLDLDDPDYLSGGNLVLDLEQVGKTRFDDQYAIAYEDVDFCRRLRAEGRRIVYRAGTGVDHDHSETLKSLPLKVWSYGAFSRRVGPFSGVLGALRAFTRMHRRPNDQIRTALRADLRAVRPAFLALDLFLLAASLRLFLIRGLRPLRELDIAPPPSGERHE